MGPIHQFPLVTIIRVLPKDLFGTHATVELATRVGGMLIRRPKSSQVTHSDTMNRAVSYSLLLAFLLSPTVAMAQFRGMRNRVPADANTLILINAEKMFGSPVADRERWAARRKAAYDAGVSALPPDATEVLLAGRSDHEFGESLWELGMINLRNERNVSSVAARYGGTMDEINGRSATRLPGDHYVVQMGPSMLASYTPANRQDVARWLRQTDVTSAGGTLPPYLERAFGYATKVGTPIVMAMDISGAISKEEVKQRAASMQSLKSLNIPIDQLADLIHGTQGITLGISIDENEVGAIRVDFDQSPEILAQVGKPLLIEILQRQGAMIDDIRDWTPSVEGNTFLLRGKLSNEGTRKVMSVLELPASMSQAMQDANSPGADKEGTAKLLATQQYWKQLTSMMDDLREKPKRDHVKTFGQAAMWYDRYARKIDRLPIMNVDEDLLNFGATIANSFRNCESIMKGVGMRTSLRTASNQASSGGYANTAYGGYRANSGTSGTNGINYGPMSVTGGVSAMNASLQEQGRTNAIIRGQERTSGAANVQQIWQQIDEATAAMRRELVNKYSADF